MIPHYRIDMVKWVEETRKYDVEDDRELVVSFECASSAFGPPG